jgi:hypothetical protein
MPFSTKDDLCNAALNMLGEPDATPFTGGTTVRDASLRRHYDSALEHVLTMHRWDFATILAELTILDPQPTTVPPLYPYGYECPADKLRLQKITLSNGEDLKCFEVVGTTLFLDRDAYEGVIYYTSNDIEPADMPTMFSDCLVLEIAKRIAPMLTQNPQLMEQMASHHREAFAKATTAEARQTQSGENSTPLAIARQSALYQTRFQ